MVCATPSTFVCAIRTTRRDQSRRDQVFINGITHVGLDVASPSRMEDFLRTVFGLQTLRRGYYQGDYIRIMGSPQYETANQGLVILYLRPGIPSGRIHHVAFGVR